MKRRDFLKKSGIALGAAGLTTFPHVWVKDYQYAWADDDEIEVGVLYSLTGTTAIVEKQLSKVTEMAIDQINARGGVLGKKVVPIIEDPASDPRTFNEKANKLVVRDRVPSVFGSYTSASRKAVLPVFEKRKNLYWYPTFYEGFECSKNVIYTALFPTSNKRTSFLGLQTRATTSSSLSGRTTSTRVKWRRSARSWWREKAAPGWPTSTLNSVTANGAPWSTR